MSANDRCAEALEVLESDRELQMGPAVRALLAQVMANGRDGIAFPYGIREAAAEINETWPWSERPVVR